MFQLCCPHFHFVCQKTPRRNTYVFIQVQYPGILRFSLGAWTSVTLGKDREKNPWFLLLRNWRMAKSISFESFRRWIWGSCSSCLCIGLFILDQPSVLTTVATPFITKIFQLSSLLPFIFLPESEKCFYLESIFSIPGSFRSCPTLKL